LGREEAELIARVIRGDIKAMNCCITGLAKRVINLYPRVIYAADAEDILQDSFMEAFINLNKLKDRSFGWLIKRIVLNKSINISNESKKMVGT